MKYIVDNTEKIIAIINIFFIFGFSLFLFSSNFESIENLLLIKISINKEMHKERINIFFKLLVSESLVYFFFKESNMFSKLIS